jgi:hypothetical protein
LLNTPAFRLDRAPVHVSSSIKVVTPRGETLQVAESGVVADRRTSAGSKTWKRLGRWAAGARRLGLG